MSYYIMYGLLYFLKKNRFFLLVLFTGLRYEVGGDFQWYYNLALKIDMWQYERIELINKMFYTIIWELNLPAQSIIVIYGFLTIYFIQKGFNYKRLKNNRNVYLTLFCFPMFLFYFFYFIRQGLAVAIVFYSYKYVKEKNFFKFIFWIITATLVHNAAIIGIFIYYIDKFSKNFFVFLLPICIFIKDIFIFITKNLIPKYLIYLTGGHTVGGAKIYYLILMLYFLVLYLSYTNNKFYVNNRIEIKIFLLGCLLYLALGKIGIVGVRVSWYFIIYFLYIIKAIEGSYIFKIPPKLLKNIISLIMLIFLTINIKIDLERKEGQIFKYKTIFSENNYLKN